MCSSHLRLQSTVADRVKLRDLTRVGTQISSSRNLHIGIPNSLSIPPPRPGCSEFLCRPATAGQIQEKQDYGKPYLPLKSVALRAWDGVQAGRREPPRAWESET